MSPAWDTCSFAVTFQMVAEKMRPSVLPTPPPLLSENSQGQSFQSWTGRPENEVSVVTTLVSLA